MKRDLSQLVFVFTSNLLVTQQMVANDVVDLKQYIQKSLQEDLQTSELNEQITKAKLQAEISENVSTGQLTITPKISDDTKLDSPFFSVQSKFEHQFYFGTKGYVFNEMGSDFSSPQNKTTKNVVSVGVEHPLGRNKDGMLFELRENESKNLIGVADVKFKQRKIQICNKAVKEYIHAYMIKESSDIYKKQLEEAEKFYKITERDFYRQLVKKGDLIAARVDQLEMKNQYENSLADLQAQFALMKVEENSNLVSPRSSLVVKIEEVKENYDTIGAKVALKQALDQLELIKEQNKNEVNVFADVSQNKYNFIYNEENTKNTYSYSVGLKASLPLYGHKNSEKINLAAKNINDAEYKIAHINDERLKKRNELQIQLQKTIDIEKNYTTISEQMTLQLKEAEKDFLLQKVSFESYRMLKSQVLSFKLKQIQNKKQYLDLLAENMFLQENFGDICPF